MLEFKAAKSKRKEGRGASYCIIAPKGNMYRYINTHTEVEAGTAQSEDHDTTEDL